MATTTSGWPYVEPADHPVEYPTVSQALANKLHTSGLLISSAVRAADSGTLASGAASGHSCTLAGVKVGATVLALVQSVHAATTVPSTMRLNPTGLTGLTVVKSGQGEQRIITANATHSLMVAWVLTATAETVTLGYSGTLSNGSTWISANQSTITLITWA